jgi:hypothetical protein
MIVMLYVRAQFDLCTMYLSAPTETCIIKLTSAVPTAILISELQPTDTLWNNEWNPRNYYKGYDMSGQH